MPASAIHSRTRFLRPSTVVLLAGSLAAIAAALAVALLAFNDFRAAQAINERHAALLARLLEDQATRTVETGDVALAALADSPALRDGAAKRELMEPLMGQALLGLPFLRALAVLDSQGKVIASTQAGDAGARIDLQRLGPRVSPGKRAMGLLVAGRGLANVRDVPSPAVAPSGLAFIPLLRGFKNDAGQALTLVGLLNTDSFSNFQLLALEAGSFNSFIATYAGTVLASSVKTHDVIGRSLATVPVFTEYLPGKQHASYVGMGVAGPEQILAFRASTSQPLVVIVEQSYRAMAARWVQGAGALWGVGCALVLLVLGLTAVVWRSVRAREIARAAMDAAQARIAQSERDLAMLLRSVQELIFRTDAQGVITYVNARWSAFSGAGASAAVGQPLQKIVDIASRAAVAGMLDPDSTQGVRNCQAMIRFGQGRELLFDMAVVPLRVDDQLAGFAGSAVDVTERWIAQQRLQAQIAFQDILLDTSPLPISVVDTEGRVLQVNRAWEEYLGLTRTDVIGQRLAKFLPTDEAQSHVASNNQLLMLGGRTFYEAKALRADGTRRDTRVIKAAISDETNKITGVVSMLMDVSEFREAERATREARDAAEEMSRAKTEFVANMSHELRTPLQSILGFAELGSMRGKHDPKLAGMFEDIYAAGKRMLALVNDLLEVSKLESTVGTIHLERIDLRGVIRPVVLELEPLLARQHLRLNVQLADAPLVAKADPPRFQQVIRNIVANAIKFSPPGSVITLTAKIDTKGQVHVVVRDQGPGIPEAEIEQIFEAFVQSSTTKDGSGGTGLGLAICRKIVEAMGGSIYARNLQPQGAAFHVILPGRAVEETEPAAL